jgi:hypothetical protein
MMNILEYSGAENVTGSSSFHQVVQNLLISLPNFLLHFKQGMKVVVKDTATSGYVIIQDIACTQNVSLVLSEAAIR